MKLPTIGGLIIALGCASPEPKAPTFEAITPFSKLTGVHMGSKAGDLKRLRPHIRVAGYVGYEEDVGAYHITYHFPGSNSEDQEVPSSSRLKGVSALRTFDNNVTAMEFWKTGARHLAARMGTPRCSSYPKFGGAGKLAWLVNETLYSLSIFPSYGSPREKPQDPGVILSVVDQDHFDKLSSGTEQLAKCPDMSP